MMKAATLCVEEVRHRQAEEGREHKLVGEHLVRVRVRLRVRARVRVRVRVGVRVGVRVRVSSSP